MAILKWLFWVLAVLAIAVLVAGQAGLLQGRAPTDLGVKQGRLKAPSSTPNSVSSQAGLYPGHPQAAYASIEPLALQGNGAQTMEQLLATVKAMPGARVVQQQPDYLQVQFQTRWLKFVDDVEFWLDPAAGVVQVRSASRLGRRDFGVNRARIDAIRQALAARKLN